MRKGFERIKGDERILGGGQFVETVLKEAREELERKRQLQAGGYGFEWLVDCVALRLGLDTVDVLAPGKYPQSVRALSLQCYWGTRELGMTTVELSRKLNLAQPTISQAARRGRQIARDQGLSLMENRKQ